MGFAEGPRVWVIQLVALAAVAVLLGACASAYEPISEQEFIALGETRWEIVSYTADGEERTAENTHVVFKTADPEGLYANFFLGCRNHLYGYTLDQWGRLVSDGQSVTDEGCGDRFVSDEAAGQVVLGGELISLLDGRLVISDRAGRNFLVAEPNGEDSG